MMDPDDKGFWSPKSDDDDDSGEFRLRPLNIERPGELKGTAQLLPEGAGGEGIAALPPVADGPRYPYTAVDEEAAKAARSRRRWKALILGIIVSLGTIIVLFIIVPVLLKRRHSSSNPGRNPGAGETTVAGSPPPVSSPPSTSNQVANERTAFHFQPTKNWMNDPNGPMFYEGLYHLFYQYNPGGAVWGNISWGHAVSQDLIHWSYLPLALQPDQWYDAKGIWSGSATILADGTPVLLYTGYSNASEQVQNMAVPADPSDKYLRLWKKSPLNPIARAPPSISPHDFRDPTTAWKGPDGVWRILVGARTNASGSNTGLAQLYRSDNFTVWTQNTDPLHSIPGTGMWEMPDFYPVSLSSNQGLDASYNESVAVKHVLKISSNKLKADFYAVGDYDTTTDTWDPIDGSLDIGKGLKYDYGKYYASKAFYDSGKQRRVLMSWVSESDLEVDDVAKGWASVQAIPRTIFLDEKFGSQLRQLPVEEVKSLRTTRVEKADLMLSPGTFVHIEDSSGNQLDIEASFEIPDTPADVETAAANYRHSNPGYTENCSALGVAAGGVVGPFGVGVLVGGELQEMTAIYFEMVPAMEPSVWQTRVCSDQTRSSLAADVTKVVYGSSVQVAYGEQQLSVRILVDHSIVEVFAQNGRTCITSRVYPQLAIGNEAKVVLFNNGTIPVVLDTLSVWQMSAITINLL